MPDFERITRSLELHLANDRRRPAVAAYHAGLDRARREAAVVTVAVAVLSVLLKLLMG